MRPRGEFRGAVVRGAGYAVGRGLVRACIGGLHLLLALALLWVLWRHLPQVTEHLRELIGRAGR
jgi:hypothetical protein